jgi:hypothetical protein
MKNPRFITITATLLALPVALHSAEDRKMQNAAYQASVEQEQLRSQTRRLVASISAMLEEFRKNPAAVEEVKLTEATLKKLQSLSDEEMTTVVETLREASKAGTASDTSPKVLAANKTTKEIQLTLSNLADKLALYQDEASIELKLLALLRRQIANQRQARYLRDGVLKAEEQAKESELTSVEQKAIADESNAVIQSLGRLAANPASSGKAVFAATYNAGNAAQLVPHSQQASTSASAKDFPNTHASQAKVIEALQTMLISLSTDKTLEERYRAAEQKMRSLSQKEQALARLTTNAGLPQQRSIIRRQQEIADQRTLVEREILQLSPGASTLLDTTRQSLDTIDNTLQKNAGTLDRPNEKLGVVNAQGDLAKNFLEIAEMLKKQGDAVAQSSNSGEGGSNSPSDALSDAADSASKAITNIDMAKDLLGRGGDADSAKDQIAKAQGNIDKAMSQLGNAGDSSPKGAGENLKDASTSLDKGGEQANKGGGPDERNKANANLGDARNSAVKALAEIQKQLSAMSTQNQMLAGSQSENNSQNPTEGTGQGGGWGTTFKHTNDYTSFSALTKVSAKDREAISMLQREKAPPEYDTMSRQYMKNLAEGVVPAQ